MDSEETQPKSRTLKANGRDVGAILIAAWLLVGRMTSRGGESARACPQTSRSRNGNAPVHHICGGSTCLNTLNIQTQAIGLAVGRARAGIDHEHGMIADNIADVGYHGDVVVRDDVDVVGDLGQHRSLRQTCRCLPNLLFVTAFRPLPFSPISRGPEAYWLMGQIYSACIG